ncbi:MAG: biopolymer transporter ExbD [Spirochaetaceae bacterium]|nr:biopolymer transporter ExbD [Spirochaetaceae bacterium]
MRIQRKLQPITAINMTPLVDVILQLIIFFMITTTFKTAPGILLQLPGSTTSQSVQSSVLKVVAVSESEIYVDREKTDLRGLPAVIKRRASGGDPSAMKAMLEGDRDSSYQLMISVLDAFRKNGIEAVGLRTLVEGAAP